VRRHGPEVGLERLIPDEARPCGRRPDRVDVTQGSSPQPHILLDLDLEATPLEQAGDFPESLFPISLESRSIVTRCRGTSRAIASASARAPGRRPSGSSSVERGGSDGSATSSKSPVRPAACFDANVNWRTEAAGASWIV
jgi:hypothetical protein